MPYPEVQIQLPPAKEPADVSHAIFVAVMLLALAATLLPPFVASWTSFPKGFPAQLAAWLTGSGDKAANTEISECFVGVWTELTHEMLHPLLLPALGLLLVFQRRSFDLSVWMSFCLGAGVGAVIVASGAHPLWALAGAMGAGLGMGLVNAGAVAVLHVPAPLISLGTATAGMGVVWAIVGPAPLRLSGEQLARWPGAGNYLVLAFFAAAVATLWALRGLGHKGKGVGVALIASGVLSALGGVCWLAKSGEAPSPTWIIGDLRVLAAAVLAGGLVITAPGMRLLAAIMLPAAMLLATAWRQMVLDVPTVLCAVNLLVLAGASATAQLALLAGRRPVRWVWALIAGAAPAILATSVWTAAAFTRVPLIAAGLGCWAVGLAGAIRERARVRFADGR